MAPISAFGVTRHSQTFSLFFRDRIQCIALYQLHNSQALLNLRRGYYSQDMSKYYEIADHRCIAKIRYFDIIQLFCIKYNITHVVDI